MEKGLSDHQSPEQSSMPPTTSLAYGLADEHISGDPSRKHLVSSGKPPLYLREESPSAPTTQRTSSPQMDQSDRIELTQLPALQRGDGRWAASLLIECAAAVVQKDAARVQHFMWMLNELASPYGDFDQRLASCFLQGLFCRITGTGSRQHRVLCSAAERQCLFDPMRKMMLKFQEMSPWTTFGHVAANGALMEAVEGEFRVHILDVSSTMCTQWPTLLEALATRSDGAPHLRLTSILVSSEEAVVKVMTEVGARLRKFARLMGVPFEFRLLQQPELELLDVATIQPRAGEALIVNCIHSLHNVSERPPPSSSSSAASPRDLVLNTFRSLNPKLVIIADDEADLISRGDFMSRFVEAVRYYSLFFESVEESFPRTSNERLMLERIVSRKIVNLLACDEASISERQEKSSQWVMRMRRAGFALAKFSDDVADDARALLKRYKEGWGYTNTDVGLFLTWKEQPTVFATSWKPF
ncbi:GRAS family protein [Selaginella moellendorffii]|uniref:GRAS family protein n=1 Tax=Selaginella moellendorffii TaxID=88036 RepID=D8SC19_SELML|nr:protein SHORT-ROOT [Selaginella moellendorffii]EFJ18110.1 GRAS family protein [Selaginella moellendorffii]|eukprot:XP_002980925.1 protein SHORT-ROOT [Selaginella moellendorffii]